MMRTLVCLGLWVAASCGVEKLPPFEMTHRGPLAPPRRVVVIPTDCVAAQWVMSNTDPKAWCKSVDQMIASELAFRGLEVVDLSRLPAQERTREVIEVVSIKGRETSEHRRVTVVGPTYSDVDMWTQRRALAELGISGLVRVRTAHVDTWPARAIAMVRITRPGDAALIQATMCQLEVSRLTGDLEAIERSVRCALKGLSL